jgi:hypothetical protein
VKKNDNMRIQNTYNLPTDGGLLQAKLKIWWGGGARGFLFILGVGKAHKNEEEVVVVDVGTIE